MEKNWNKLLILLTTLSLLAGTLIFRAGATVVVDDKGKPLSGVAIYNAEGKFICITDSEGRFDLDNNAYPLRLRMLSMGEEEIASPTDSISMAPSPLRLEEVIVTASEKPFACVRMNLKEQSTMVLNSDTLYLSASYTIDYLLEPRKQKIKNTHIVSDEYELLSTGNLNYDDELKENILFMIKWGPQLVDPVVKRYTVSSVDDKGNALPDSVTIIRAMSTGRDWMRTTRLPENIKIDFDFLADKKDGHWKPWFLKLIGASIDITEASVTLLFNRREDNVYGYDAPYRGSLSMKMYASGKFIKLLVNAKGEYPIYTFIEFEPIDITYLTPKEAKRFGKD